MSFLSLDVPNHEAYRLAVTAFQELGHLQRHDSVLADITAQLERG